MTHGSSERRAVGPTRGPQRQQQQATFCKGVQRPQNTRAGRAVVSEGGTVHLVPGHITRANTKLPGQLEGGV